MNSIFKTITGLWLLALLAACGNPTPGAPAAETPAASGSRLSVVATYSILGDLVQNVGGDAIDLKVLVGPGGDAHTFEPTPADSVTLAQAQLLFENGLEFETWLDDLYTASGSTATRVVVTNAITPRAMDESHSHGHEHGHDKEHGHGHDHSDPLAHACDHFDDAPTAVTAAATSDAGAAAIPDDHTRYDVALAGGEGYVALTRDEAAEVSFFLGADVPFALLQGDTPVAPEATEAISEGCAAIKMVYTYDLEAGAYVVRFGPGAGDLVTLVWETAGKHGHDEHGDHGHDEHGDHGHDEHGDHGHDEHGDHGHDEHGDHGHGGHSHGEFDPHVWHDPNNAMLMVEAIRDALVQADAANAATYQANAAAYLAQLRELDAFVQEQVAQLPAERRKLVTTHDTFGYFADRYGFEVLGTALGSVSTEVADPSAAAIAELVGAIRAAGVPAIFAENIANPRLMETIANEAGVELAPTLYTDALGDAGGAGATYIEMMRFNVTTIVTALT